MAAKKPTPEQLARILLGTEGDINLLDELIATGEAAFSLIRHSELEPDLKSAFHQLEKQFSFYSQLLEDDPLN
jgi:hypothetical protein